MEPHNDSQLSSYYHPATTVAAPTNGLLPPPSSSSADGIQMVYSAAAPSAAVSPPPLEPIKRKRGRPRKYGTPEQALAAKKAATTSSAANKERKHQHQGFGASSSQPPYSGPSRKSHSSAVGQGFTPHVITVAAGEDVAQKIMFFMQQSKREICILSASGSISNASLCQPATSGGNVTYEGRFEIITLSGSFVRTDPGGRTGGLSVCLCDTTGQIIGGGVGGPLIAAGPVQVIVGSFLVDSADPSLKAESSGRLASPVSVPLPQSGLFRPTLDSSSPSPYMVQTGAHM